MSGSESGLKNFRVKKINGIYNEEDLLMSVYFGLKKKSYETNIDRIGCGGEGSIFTLVNNDKQVAKLYKEQYRTKQREEKLRMMVQYDLTEEQLQQVVWPQDVLYDNNQFVGYIMPILVNTSSLTEVYSSNSFDLRHRVLIAYHLCVAVKTVHEMGQVCGDLNPLNICVNLDDNEKENMFKVTLIDTDSYHITSGDKTYRCEVGLGDFIAPELQKKLRNGGNLIRIDLPTYTRETDLFAVAVHIFYLLMNGCHPFASAKETNRMQSSIAQFVGTNANGSVAAPQLIDNIGYGYFPFYEKREGVSTPIYAPDFDTLPEHIRDLFVKTFIDGYFEPTERASLDDWISALSDTISSIVRCEVNERHYYFSHNQVCPMCVIDNNIREYYKQDLVEAEAQKESSNVEEEEESGFEYLKEKLLDIIDSITDMVNPSVLVILIVAIILVIIIMIVK
ncbi:MAG: hypothetical protein K6G11_07175 [Lachnospiraceae bacterium]|nr:hypothetical protein [Lachnospiraceae bacterium]